MKNGEFNFKCKKIVLLVYIDLKFLSWLIKIYFDAFMIISFNTSIC